MAFCCNAVFLDGDDCPGTLSVPVCALISITLHSQLRSSSVICASRTYLHLCLGLAWSMAGTSLLSAAAVPTQVRAPTVNCVGNDQVDSSLTQKGASVPVPVEQFDRGSAGLLQGRTWVGYIRPQGLVLPGVEWLERKLSGGDAEAHSAALFPLAEYRWSRGDDRDLGWGELRTGSRGRRRFATLFSSWERVRGRVRQEHLIADSAFDPESYPDDQLQYLSDRFVNTRRRRTVRVSAPTACSTCPICRSGD